MVITLQSNLHNNWTGEQTRGVEIYNIPGISPDSVQLNKQAMKA